MQVLFSLRSRPSWLDYCCRPSAAGPATWRVTAELWLAAVQTRGHQPGSERGRPDERAEPRAGHLRAGPAAGRHRGTVSHVTQLTGGMRHLVLRDKVKRWTTVGLLEVCDYFAS